MKKDTYLFQQGVEAFNNRYFYDAHEFWEELWLEYKLEDADFIQGLIQLAVSYFHYYNGNLKGARSMAKKSLLKFKTDNSSRGIDTLDLKSKIQDLHKYYLEINNTSYNIDRYTITLKVIHE